MANTLEILLLAGLAAFVAMNYFIRAYSDPMNYLSTARRVFEEYGTSRWPVIYPLFLWLALHVTGPYWIFLINLPVLAGLLFALSRLVREAAAETETPGAAALLGAAAGALVLAYNPSMLPYLANPYRDPLALLANTLAALWLVRYVRDPRHPARLVALSGLATGLSYSIREPSILMLIPMGVFALHAAWRDRRIPFWKSVAMFGAPALLGALPFLVQTYLRTHQVWLPGEAAVAGKLPGMHDHAFAGTFPRALEDVWTQAGPFGAALIVLGLAWTLFRGGAAFRFLFLPAVLLNLVFYSFYWTFVRRYFVVVTLFAAPLTAFGLFRTVEAVLRPLPRVRRAAAPAAALALAALAGWRLFSITPSPDRFRVADAKALTAAIHRAVPAGAEIFCPRNLCEVLDWFTHARSRPLAALLAGRPAGTPADVRREIEELRAKGARPFLMEVAAAGRRDPALTAVRRLYDLERAAALAPSEFHLDDIVGAPSVTLWALQPWTMNETEQAVEGIHRDRVILRVDAGVLWDRRIPRRHARLYLNGVELDGHVSAGANFYGVDLSRLRPPYKVKLKSDQPAPADLAPVFLDPAEPLVLDLGGSSNPSYESLLSTDFEVRPLSASGPRLANEGTITLPDLWPKEIVLCAEMSACATRAGDDDVQVEIRTGAERLASGAIPKDRRFHSVTAVLPRSRKGEPITLLLTVDDNEAPDERRSGIELDHIRITPVRPGPSFDLDVGEEGDAVFAVDGFYRAERAPGGQSIRWTAARAELRVFLEPPARDVRLDLACVDAPRPPGAPEASLAATFNGRPLELNARLDTASGLVHFEARIPKDAVARGANALELTCTPWVPGQHMATDDTRELGVLVDRLSIRPAEGP